MDMVNESPIDFNCRVREETNLEEIATNELRFLSQLDRNTAVVIASDALSLTDKYKKDASCLPTWPIWSQPS